MTPASLTILSAALSFEAELRKELLHSKWARDRRYRINKSKREAEQRSRTTQALEAELQGGPKVVETA